MRTTLKRGIGRVNGLNGNGHSALPPLFGPITRYRQPDPPKRSVTRVILRGFGWLVLAIVVVASGAAGGLYLYGHESLAAVAPRDQPTKNAGRKASRCQRRPSRRSRSSRATTTAPATGTAPTPARTRTR